MRTTLALALILLIAAPLAADTAATWKSKCAACHGPDGAGNTSMGKKLNLRALDSPEVQKLSDAELTTIIAKGKNKMPGYAGKIDDAEIAGLVKYIRSLAKK